MICRVPRRLALIAAVVLAACSFGTPPHSEYFVLTYLPGTVDLTAEGKQALANAARSASSGSAVLIRGVSDAALDPHAQGMIRLREKAVTDALVAAGAPIEVIRVDNRAVSEAEFANRADSLIIQVMFGAAPPS